MRVPHRHLADGFTKRRCDDRRETEAAAGVEAFVRRPSSVLRNCSGSNSVAAGLSCLHGPSWPAPFFNFRWRPDEHEISLPSRSFHPRIAKIVAFCLCRLLPTLALSGLRRLWTLAASELRMPRGARSIKRTDASSSSSVLKQRLDKAGSPRWQRLQIQIRRFEATSLPRPRLLRATS